MSLSGKRSTQERAAYKRDRQRPDWVSDLAACLALAVTMVEKEDRPGLQAFAHRELDRAIAERIAEKERDEPE